MSCQNVPVVQAVVLGDDAQHVGGREGPAFRLGRRISVLAGHVVGAPGGLCLSRHAGVFHPKLTERTSVVSAWNFAQSASGVRRSVTSNVAVMPDIWTPDAWAAVRSTVEWNRYLDEHQGLYISPSWEPDEPLMMRDGSALHYRPDRWRVFEVKHTHDTVVSVLEMGYNYRVVCAPVILPTSLSGGWCYFGRDSTVLARALHAAWEWDPDAQDSPAWYDKDVLGRTAPRASGTTTAVQE